MYMTEEIMENKYFYLLSLTVILLQNIYAQTDFVNSNISINDSDIVAIVCNSSIAQGGNVYLAVIDRANNYLFIPIIVNSKLLGYAQNADVGIDKNGTISVVWEQWLNGCGTVYRSRFTSLGYIVDSAQCITDSILSSGSVKISVTPNGKSVAAWIDYRFNKPMIFGQRFDEKGNKIGSNFVVSNGKSLPQYPYCNVSDSLISFVWQDVENKIFHVYTSSCSWDLRWLPEIIVDKGNGAAHSSNPEIFLQKNDKKIIVWKDYRTGESNIYFQMLTKQQLIVNLVDKMINDDKSKRWQRLPRLSGSKSKGFICVWEDYRNNSENQIGDIYGQLFFSNGKPKGKNFKINRTQEPTIQEFPSVAMNERGSFSTAWTDGRDSSLKIYLQRFNARAERILGETVILPFTK